MAPPLARSTRRTRRTPATRARGRRAHDLLDDLVGPQQQRRRDREAERLGGLEVDDELELGRLLHRKIGGLGTFQDLIYIGRGEPGRVRLPPSLRQQAAPPRLLP